MACYAAHARRLVSRHDCIFLISFLLQKGYYRTSERGCNVCTAEDKNMTSTTALFVAMLVALAFLLYVPMHRLVSRKVLKRLVRVIWRGDKFLAVSDPQALLLRSIKFLTRVWWPGPR